jgi:hypothetical protein
MQTLQSVLNFYIVIFFIARNRTDDKTEVYKVNSSRAFKISTWLDLKFSHGWL